MGLGFSWFDASVPTSPDNSTTQIFFQPIYNFQADVANSGFIRGGLGIQTGNQYVLEGLSVLNDSSTQFYWALGAGRRFEIVKHLSWAPEVSWTGIEGTDVRSTVTHINVVPIQVTAIF